MLNLIRKGDEVYFGEQKLTIVAQQTKGPGHECVKIADLPGANGQKWVALAKLQEGENEIECKAREVSISSQQYKLTEDEAAEVAKLKARIDEIIAGAKARFVPTMKMPTLAQAQKMTDEQKAELVKQLENFLASSKA